ncbi:hypothetical protein WN73_11015 [Bradyrhizobium sp. CCBAU 45394]|nr:hypothetical protein [Bradyrhizobium sp. CCBAU 45394]
MRRLFSCQSHRLFRRFTLSLLTAGARYFWRFSDVIMLAGQGIASPERPVVALGGLVADLVAVAEPTIQRCSKDTIPRELLVERR